MSYSVILLLGLRPFVCEQSSIISGLIFNFIFCASFFIFILSQRRFNIKSPLPLLAFGFPLLIIFSNLYSVNSCNSQSAALEFFVQVCMFSFVCSLNIKERGFLLRIIAAVACIIGLRALYQNFFGLEYIKNHFSREELTRSGFYAWEILKQNRVVSWFAAPNLLASYLLMVIPVCGGFLLNSVKKQRRKKAFLFSFILVCLLLVLLFTKSIGAFISFILSAGLGFILSINERRSKLILLLSIFAVLILCLFVALIFGGRSDFFLNLDNPQNSLVQRAYYWQTAKEIIQRYPLQGIGAGNFGTVYPRYKQINANETAFAHNSYMQLWAESGIFALVFLVCLVGLIFKSAKSTNSSRIDSMLVVSCGGFSIHNLVDYSFFVPQVSTLWWILLGCILADNHRPDEDFKRVSAEKLLLQKIIYLCFGLLLLFNIYLELDSQLNINKAVEYFKKKEYNASIKSASKALACKPNNDKAYYILAHNHRMMAKDVFSIEAKTNYQKAIKLNSHYAFYYYELAGYLGKFGFKKEARHFFVLGMKYYPHNPRLFKIAPQKNH